MCVRACVLINSDVLVGVWRGEQRLVIVAVVVELLITIVVITMIVVLERNYFEDSICWYRRQLQLGLRCLSLTL